LNNSSLLHYEAGSYLAGFVGLLKTVRKFGSIFLLASSSATVAFANVDVADALMRANILRPDQSISADVHERDATISTYMNKHALKNKDAVCRLDAVLIAKKVTELVPSIKKVRVWFHEYTGSNYREVIVSADDLNAFEAGKLTKEQLMARLKVRLAQSLNSGETFIHAPAPPPPEVGGIKTGTGVSIYFPKGWHLLPRSTDKNVLAALARANSPAPDVSFTVVGTDAAATDQGVRKSVKIGAGAKAMGVDVTTVSDVNGKHVIERRVYFTDGRYNYKLNLICGTDEFSRMNADFNYILSTLLLPT
jgi:hypothetical protein